MALIITPAKTKRNGAENLRTTNNIRALRPVSDVGSCGGRSYDQGRGRRWYWGAKDTTDDYRSIDVRRWKRDGLLTPDQSFGWQWSRRGEVVASIRVRTEPDRVILTYHQPKGMHWSTFERLTAQHHGFVQTSVAVMEERANLFEKSLRNRR